MQMLSVRPLFSTKSRQIDASLIVGLWESFFSELSGMCFYKTANQPKKKKKKIFEQPQ